MPTRWVISPVETVTADGGSYRRPVVAALWDAGRVGKGFRWSAIISDGQPGQVNDWCLVFVRGVTLATLDEASTVHPAVEEDDLTDAGRDGPPFLAQTPRELGWTPAKITRVRDRLIARGADVTGITQDSPLYELLLRLGRVLRPDLTLAGLRDTWAR